MSRRNDFIRSRRQDADGAGDFGSRQVGTEVVGQNELDGQVGEEVPGGLQQAVKGNQKYQFFYIPDGGDLVATPEPRLWPTRMTSSGVLPVSFSTSSRMARESPMMACSVGLPVLRP